MSLKIAVTSTISWPYVRRGSRIAYELSIYLAKQGHQVHYIAMKPGEVSRRKIQDGIVKEYYPLMDNPLLTMFKIEKFDTFALPCLRSLIQNDFDIVQSIFPMDAFAASLNKGIRRTPFVHYMIDCFEPYYYITKYGKFVFNRCLKSASRIAVMSKFVNQNIKKKFGMEGVVIPGAVDMEQFTFCENKELDPPRILSTVAINVLRKRVGLLVKAFERLLDYVPNAILQLSGHTDPAHATKSLLLSVSPKTRKAIEILGVGKREDLPALYRQAAITVLPSVNEAFGLVLVESLASGTPVVGTRSGGIPDILHDEGIGVLFEPTDGPEELCKALLKGLELARNPDTWEKCRFHAEAYSWNSVVHQFENLYLEILNSNKRKRRRISGRDAKGKNLSSNHLSQHTPLKVKHDKRALNTIFNDTIDELEITYETYWKMDLNRPLCLYILNWLLRREIRDGHVLMISLYPRPLTMFLKKFGFSVKEIRVILKQEPWQEIEKEILLSDFWTAKELSESYNLIICDDLLQYLSWPCDVIQRLKDRLTSKGILILTTLNVARGAARFCLLSGRNVYPEIKNDMDNPSIDGPDHNITMYREYTLKEAKDLVRSAGFNILESNYFIGKKTIESGFFLMSVHSYFLRRIYYLFQKTFPAMRSHIFVAASKM